ncbi:MAG: hypothetical protein E6P95_03945 [Candidatus Moraniibacteriota bacterium]|nr:MAG: hypothetical protein E6P95_03945 [Candidatus Moranbacteria bacterium]
MQRIATKIFIYASITFGIIGVTLMLASPFGPDQPDTPLQTFLLRLLFSTVFIILPSFALSIAGKYLDGKF